MLSDRQYVIRGIVRFIFWGLLVGPFAILATAGGTLIGAYPS